jgi:soluble lytic murein transglycosylase-like protein
MKLLLLALVLGCSALVLTAVQSDAPSLDGLEIQHAPHWGLSLAGLSFPGVTHAAAPPPPPAPKPHKAKDKLGVDQTLRLIAKSARKHKVPATFVRSIVEAESNYDPQAVSKTGAIGLMQLMPDTAQEMGASDPTIPEQNVDAGTRYLRTLMDRYSKHRDPLKRVIAAYNAGPANVDRYKGVPPFRETRCYVKRVIANLRQLEGIPKKDPVTFATIAAD